MDTRTHAYLSPSRLERAEACPGSARMEKMAPEPPPSAAADEGEELHRRVPPTAPLDDLND